MKNLHYSNGIFKKEMTGFDRHPERDSLPCLLSEAGSFVALAKKDSFLEIHISHT
jgi:hypothetical protein